MERCCRHYAANTKRQQTLHKVPKVEFPPNSKGLRSSEGNQKSGHSPDNVNMRVNEQFTASHVRRDTRVLSDEKFPREQTAFIESQCTWNVSGNVKSDNYLGNKDFLVNILTEDNHNKKVNSSRQIQQNSAGVSLGSEREYLKDAASLQIGSLSMPSDSNGNYSLRTEHFDPGNSSSKNNSAHLSGDKLRLPCDHGVSTTKKSTSDDGLSCRICHSASDLESLVSPCLCTGSMKYVHESCLLNWLKSSFKTNCELCLHEVPVRKMVKPLREVRSKYVGMVTMMMADGSDNEVVYDGIMVVLV